MSSSMKFYQMLDPASKRYPLTLGNRYIWQGENSSRINFASAGTPDAPVTGRQLGRWAAYKTVPWNWVSATHPVLLHTKYNGYRGRCVCLGKARQFTQVMQNFPNVSRRSHRMNLMGSSGQPTVIHKLRALPELFNKHHVPQWQRGKELNV